MLPSVPPPPSAIGQPPAATPAPAQPAAAKKPARKKKTAPPPEPALPEPKLHLTLQTPSPDGPWTLRAENTGDVPLVILADARLLALEVTPPEAPESDPKAGGKKHPRVHTVKCELPSDMRPDNDDDRALTIPPGRAYAGKLDPRLFCFGAHFAEALEPGAKVTPILIGSHDFPAVAPVTDIDDKPATVATERTFTGDASVIGAAPPALPPADTSPHPIAVTTPPFADFGLGWEVEVTVTVKNESQQSMVFLLRSETLAFDVTGPSGVGATDPSPTFHCGHAETALSPIPEAYTHLAPKEEAQVTVLLSALCPDDALRRPGLYFVRAKLDTRHASGRSIGVHTFEGEARGSTVTRVRVRDWSGTDVPHRHPPHLVPDLEATGRAEP
jgi:hypothetical protein